MKVIIVGGVAGGASCAARLRRLDEKAEIIMVERGPYVSYANCGLPYHIGGVIEKESSLLVATEATFRDQFKVDCRRELRGDQDFAGQEDRGAAQCQDRRGHHRDLRQAGAVARRAVDPPATARHRPARHLPGANCARRPGDPRVDRKGSRFLAGMDSYSGFQTVRPETQAVVIGGGFIGLETAENLVHRGFEVTVVELADQVLGPLDAEMARRRRVPRIHGVHVMLDDGVAGFEQPIAASSTVQTQSGKRYPADIVILALGVRPDTTLARMAGLEIGEHGGIRVDDQMRTSDPDIFAVGDAIEVSDFVTGGWSLIALAGPANRQARIAADVIAGRDSRFRGTQGTSIVELFGSAVAWTGASEKTLNAWVTPTSRRSTCIRTLTPGTTRAPSRSR